MTHNIKYRLFSIILICVISFNTVHYTRVEASSIAATLGSVVAGSGGAAAFGSAALGVAVPLLLAVGTAYAGYKIYQNREQILSTFHSWYTTSSNAIKSWCTDISNAINDGTLTDGDVISIPKNVVQEVDRFYDENKIIGDITSIQGTSISINSIASKAYTPALESKMKESAIASFAPVLHIRHNNMENTTDIKERIVYGKGNTTVGMMIYQMMSSNGTTYWYFDYISSSSIDNGTIKELASGNSEYLYTFGADAYSSSGRIVMPAGNINISGNTITSDSWDYTIDLYVPESAFLGYIPNTISATYTQGISSGYQGYYQHPLSLSQYQILQKGNYTDTISQNIISHGLTYNPSAWVGNNTDAVEVTLTPQVVNALNDYVVTKKINEIDLVQTIDPAGFVTDIPTDNEDTTIVEGILDGISDFFTNPLGSILGFLQRILDAILSIPSAIIAIPGQFASWWEKLWEKIQEIIDTVLSLPNSLINTLQELFEWLFVPDKVVINEYVMELEKTITDRYGLLTYPLSLVIKFLNQLNAVGNKECILKIPKIEFKGHVLLEEYQFNFTQYVKKSEFNEIYNYYMIITNFILILAVVNLAMKKGSEIIRGN